MAKIAQSGAGTSGQTGSANSNLSRIMKLSNKNTTPQPAQTTRPASNKNLTNFSTRTSEYITGQGDDQAFRHQAFDAWRSSTEDARSSIKTPTTVKPDLVGQAQAGRNAAIAQSQQANKPATSTPTVSQPRGSSTPAGWQERPATIVPGIPTPTWNRMTEDERQAAQNDYLASQERVTALQERAERQAEMMQGTEGKSNLDLYLRASNRYGTADQNDKGDGHWNATLAQTARDINNMYLFTVAPAYKTYEQAMKDYEAGTGSYDAALKAYNEYMAVYYQYAPMQQAYEAIRATGGLGVSGDNSLDVINQATELWDATLGAAEKNIEQLEKELNEAEQKYIDASMSMGKLSTPKQRQEVEDLYMQYVQKSGEYNAAMFVYGEMAGNFTDLDEMARTALYREYPELTWAENVTREDSDGNLHFTESSQDLVNRIEDLQNRAYNTTDEKEREKLTQEANWYLYAMQIPSMYDEFSADEIQASIDYLDQQILSLQQGATPDYGLPTTEDELDAFLLENGYSRSAIDAAIQQGYTREQLARGVRAEQMEAEGKDPYSLTGELPQDKYNEYVTQLSIIRNALSRMKRGKVYQEALGQLSTETRDRMDAFVAAGVETGMDLTDLILSPDSASTAATRLLLRDKNPELLTEIEGLRQDFKDAGFTDEEAEGLLLYAAREINDERVSQLMSSINARAEQKSEVFNFLSTVGNSFVSGSGHMVDLLRFTGLLPGGRDAFTGEFYIDPNASEHDPYHTMQANEANRQARVNSIVMDIFGEKEYGEKMAEMANKFYGLSISMGQSNAIRGLTMLGLPCATLLLGASAGEARTMEMIDRGYSDGAALVAGVIAATGETLSEKVSLDHFMKGVRSAGKGLSMGQWLWQALIGRTAQGGVEASEEVASDIFQFLGDYLVVRWLNGGVSEIDQRANEIRLTARAEDPPRNIDWAEAQNLAWKDWVKGVGNDAIGGLMSGLLMGDGQVLGAIQNVHSDVRVGKAVLGLDQWLANRGFEPRMVAELQRVVDSIDAPTAMSAHMTGADLKNAYQIGHAMQNLPDAYLADAINSRLQYLGETNVTPALVSAIDAASHGYRLSAVERIALRDSRFGQQVVEELQSVWNDEADPNSAWATDALAAGQAEKEFFTHVPDLFDTKKRVDAAYSQVNDGLRTSNVEDPATTISTILNSGFARDAEIYAIIDDPALRAEFEKQIGEKLTGSRKHMKDIARKYLLTSKATLEQIQAQRTQNANPGATVMGPAASALAEAGMADANRALVQGELLDAIANGKELSPFDMRKLNLADPAVRRVFIRLTGMSNLPTVISSELKEALVNRAVDSVKKIQETQEAIAESAEQLFEAQQEQASAQLDETVRRVMEEQPKKRTTKKTSRAQNREAYLRDMSRAYEQRLASGGRRRRIEVSDRTEQDVVRQIKQQSGVSSIQSKSAFEQSYRTYMGIAPNATLNKEQRIGLDAGYERYLMGLNLTAQERDALNEAWWRGQRRAERRGKRVVSEERHPYDERLTPPRNVEGTVTFDSSVDLEALKKEGGIRWTSVQVLRRLAKSLGVNFRIYATTEQDGERVWIDGDGKKHSDNGMYDPTTNEILIDLNAGGGGQGTMLFTTAHELVHWMRDFHAKSYDALANYLLDMYADNGNDVHELQQTIIDKYAKKGITLTMDGTALEELVARSMEAMLTDGNVLQNLEGLRDADRGAFNKVVQYIQNLVDKIKDLYKSFKPDTAEARYVQEMGNAFLDLQQLFTEGLINASKSYKVNSVLANSAMPINTRVSEQTAEDLAEINSAEVDGVIVSDENAELMEEDGFEKPVDPLDQDDEELMHSERTEEAWEETYRTRGGEESVLEAMQTFIKDVRANDAIMRFIPTGSYKYQKKGFGPLRKNVEYIRTFDMDASCPRTFQFVNYRNRLQQIAGRPLTDAEAMNLMFVMRVMNQQIPCTYCYVENKRILKSISYLNYFKFRAAVMSAATDEEALPLMYSYNEKTGKVTDAAKKVFDEWRSDVKKGAAFYPSAEEAWTSFQTAKNSVWNWLDQQLEEGTVRFGDGVKKPTSNKQINALVNEHFGVTAKEAQREIAGMIEKWQYDTLAGVQHNYEITNDESTSEVNQDMLVIHRLASNYAASSSQARNVDDYVPYTDEVKNLSAKDKAFIIGMGGIRKHSSNDFRIDYVIDYFQFFADLAREKLTGHTYTKSVEYCRIFGRTGDRINLSIAMDTVNGKIVPNTQEGADWDEARDLRAHYGDLGVMALVTDNAQLSYALNSDWIDMMIPFHASGLPKAVWGDIRAWNDYTSVQLESYYTLDDMKKKLDAKGVSYAHLLDTTARVQELIREGKSEKDAKAQASAERKTAIEDLFYSTFNIKIIRNKNGQRVKPHFFPGDTKVQGPHGMQVVPGHGNDVKKYFELCEQYGVHPRFKGIQVSDKDGNIIDVTEHPGYLKLIKETSRTGQGVLDNNYEQKPIRFSFNEVDPYLSELMGKDTTPMQYALHKLQLDAESNGYENLKKDQAGVIEIFKELYLNKDRPIGWMPERPNMDVPGKTQAEELTRMMYTYIDATDKGYKEMHDADLRVLSDAQRAAGELMRASTENDVAIPGPDIMSSLRETDPGVLKFLNDQLARGEYIRTYKTYLEVVENGEVKLYAPMAVMQMGPDGKKRFSNPLKPGEWEKSVGNVESANIIPAVDKHGNRKTNERTKRPAWDYNLDKEPGGGRVPAAFNPYQHSSDYVLNDQFTKAYSRPRLATYECVIPLSELTSQYAYSEIRSDGERIDAKDAVGKHRWKKGPVAGKLKNTDRQVYMTRWLMPVRRVSNAEVAQQYKEILDRESTKLAVPFNTVPPGLQLELERLGVPIDYTGEGSYKKWHRNNPEGFPGGQPILGTAREAELVAYENSIPTTEVVLPATSGHTYRAEDITQGLNFNDPKGILLNRIRSGQKQYETRQYTEKKGNGQIAPAYLNRPMGIIQTGDGKAKLVGFWELGDGKPRDFTWLSENSWALGNEGTDFQAKPGDTKWVYPIKWVEWINPVEVDTLGNVARDISAITSQMTDVRFSARDLDERNLTPAQAEQAAEAAAEAERVLDEMIGKGQAKKLKQTVRRLENRAVKAEQKAEIQKEKAGMARLEARAAKQAEKEAKREANKTIRNLTRDNKQAIKEKQALQKKLDTQIERDKKKLANIQAALDAKKQQMREQGIANTAEKNEMRREFAHTIAVNARTDKQWANKLYQSAVRNERKDAKRKQREALDKQEASLTGKGRAARRVIDSYRSRPAPETSIHAEDEPLPNLFPEKPLLPEFTVDGLFRQAIEKTKAGADKFLRTFENYAQEIDRMARYQGRPDNLSVKVSNVRAAKAVPARIWDFGLIVPGGNAEGPAMKDVLLCLDENGKIDAQMQNDLNSFMIWQLTADRMSVVQRAEQRKEAWVEQHDWLRDVNEPELVDRVLAGDKVATRYLILLKAAAEARNKAVVGWADEFDSPVTAEEAQRYVDEVKATKPELVKKANAIYDYWDAIMRTYAVGTLISEEQYDIMREIYPHYIPAFREMDEGGDKPITAMMNNDSLVAAPATKAAKGSTRKLLRLEDQYVKALQQVVRAYYENDFLQQLIGEFMFDMDGNYEKYGFFDWDSVNRGIRDYVFSFLGMQHETNIERVKDGMYKITCYVNGEKMSAYVSRPIFEGLQGLFDKTTLFGSMSLYKKAVRLGGKILNPAKSMITGVNPAFAGRNLARDTQTALINSVAGPQFLHYQRVAAAKILRQDYDWITFQNLGGVASTKVYNESGFAPRLDRRLAVLHTKTKAGEGLVRAKNAVGSVTGTVADAAAALGEFSESISRFAEYLATLDMYGGDSYINRQIAIRNAAEVTVDFGRRGTMGSLINNWVMYWNPGMQGLSKAFRIVFSQPTVRKKIKAFGHRAFMVSILPAAIQSLIIGGLGEWEEYEKLSDRIKDQNFCIPLSWMGEKYKHKFLKIPRTQDWGVFISAPFMRMMEGRNGREKPFEHYLQTAIIPNMPVGTPLPVQWLLQYLTNADSFGQTIVPYDLRELSDKLQFDADTSWLAKTIGEAINMSPMQIDQFLEDYMGNFWGPVLRLIPGSPFSPIGYRTGETTVGENVKDAWQTVKSPFIADNRYSSSIRSGYYDLYKRLQQEYKDTGSHGGDPEKDMEDFEFYKALTMPNGYAQQISALTKRARDLPPGEEKDLYYDEITGLCDEALQFYRAWQNGEVKDATHWMVYHRYGDLIMNELYELREYDADYLHSKDGEYNFSGSLGSPDTVWDKSGENPVKYVFDKDQDLHDIYDGLRAEQYQKIITEIITSDQYKDPKATKEFKAQLLEDGKTRALKEAEKMMVQYLRDAGFQGEEIVRPNHDYVETQAAYSLAQILGDDSAYDQRITNELIRLYDWNDEYDFAPTSSKKETFTSTTDPSQVYILTDKQSEKYSEIYHDTLTEFYTKVMDSDRYQAATEEVQALMLDMAKTYAGQQTAATFNQYLINSGATSEDKYQIDDVIKQDARYEIQRALGFDNSYPQELTDELVRLWDYKGDFNFMPSDVNKKYFTSPTDDSVRYVLSDEQQQKYAELYRASYTDYLLQVQSERGYDSLSGDEKARRLEYAKTYAAEKTNEEFGAWIVKQRDAKTEQVEKDEIANWDAKWDVQRILGFDNAIPEDVAGQLLDSNLYELRSEGKQNYLPQFSPPTTYTYVDEKGKTWNGYKWIITPEQREVYTAMAFDIYVANMTEVMNSSVYRQLDDYGKAFLLSAARAQTTEDTRLAFQQWLRDEGIQPVYMKTPEEIERQTNIGYAEDIVENILGR